MPIDSPILPGATLGILGGGQLGRMFTLAARAMGYRVVVLDPDPASPAGQMADVHLQADYADAGALKKMAESCRAITTEFENVPAASLIALARHTRVAPGPEAVSIAQDRIREKTWLRGNGFATAPFALITGEDEIGAGASSIAFPAILKVSRLGYDGKGQVTVDNLDELKAAFTELKGVPCVLEGFVRLETEVSVVLARTDSGECASWAVGENHHAQGILDTTTVPAGVPEAIQQEARETAMRIAQKLHYVGVMAVEFFVDRAGQLLVNEIAPRPHNSGHYTLDACVTDQFAQQVRALCGLPLGDTRLLSPVVMVNLLGNAWNTGPDWMALLQHPGIKLHLYGKAEARPGRKMGHYNCLAETVEAAWAIACKSRAALGI